MQNWKQIQFQSTETINVFDRTLFSIYVMICHFENRFILEGHSDSREGTAISMWKWSNPKTVIIWSYRQWIEKHTRKDAMTFQN